ncbi:MAG: putative lipid II flippase FtsW [Acidobacteria bacterium]|nr:putative lipid II flippase FtsW [Acidobacteriota bacterium]
MLIKQDWNIDRGLFIATLFLVGFGLVMIFNASLPISLGRFGQPHFLFYRQLMWTGIGFFIFFASTQVSLRLLQQKWVVYGLIILTAGLLLLVFTQTPINGTRRWIHMAGVSFQPSELAKLTVIIFVAWYCARFPDLSDRPWRHLVRVGLVIGPMMALIVREPDLGNAMILLAITVIMLFFAGFPLRQMIALGLMVIPAVIGVILLSPYMLERIKTFANAAADPLGKGYQIKQSLIAIGHSGFWGLGLGESTQKLFFLPEPHTDFIYAVVAEEAGFLGCIILAVLFGYLFLRGMRLSLKSPHPFNQVLGAGAISLILLEVLINSSMVIHLLPTKGIPLPFISMGGTSLLISLLAVGLVLNISREVPE